METDSRLVTILCSVYNSEKWISGYLDSINNQIFKNFDIVFVDANSKDTSLQLIKDYKFRTGINKVILEFKERINVYEAWNEAVRVSTTPYVMNVNTDDRLYPAAISTYIDYAHASPEADIFYGTCVVVGDAEHEQIQGLFQWPEYTHEVLLQMCIGGPFPMLKKSSIIEDGLFNPKYTISGDYEMWLRMSKNGRKFCRVIESVGSYYRNPTGISIDKKDFEEHVRQDTELRELYK